MNFFRGKINAVIDKSISANRRIRQVRKSLQHIPKVEYRIHLICVNRDEYLNATIACLNSFWEFHPEYSATIWVDEKYWDLRLNILAKLDRKDRVEFRIIPEPSREWQWNKLLIIVNEMNSHDYFCDADVIWNSRLPSFDYPTFYLKEYNLQSRTSTRRLLRKMSIRHDRDIFMYNVSFVFLGRLSRNMDFSSMSKRFYKSIRHCIPDAILGEGDIPQLRRMSEQIALSVAIQSHSFESLQVRVLKDKDHVMDGGIAESYYLGSSRGWQ